MRKRQEDDDDQPGWFWRFLKGVVVAAVVSAAAIAVISLYVLPPAELTPPSRQAAPEPEGPVMIGGIEVSTAPAYSPPDAAPAQPETFDPIVLTGPALEVNAEMFEADPQALLVAVVLDDTAADPLLHPLMFALDVPVTVGVVAGRDGDRETAAAARKAGFEVVAQLPLAQPGAADGDELEYGLPEDEAARRADALMRRLPMAVAASRPMAAGTPPNVTVLLGIGAALAPHGFAYLDQGVAAMDTAPGKAAGLALPVGASRFAIDAGADVAAVVAVLDAAAADAALRGGAVVLATPSEALFGAMQLWGGEGASGTAKLAPLSAVIRRLAGG